LKLSTQTAVTHPKNTQKTTTQLQQALQHITHY